VGRLFFYSQIAAFGAGVVALILAFAAAYDAKIF
jgi:hypothetical protein